MYHLPVMLSESIEGLAIKPGGIYADLTFGGGGHSRAILSKLNDQGRLIAFDQDEDALNNAIDDERFLLINQNFRYFRNFLRMHKALPLDGILADLGVSSHQIDTPERGFATRFDGPLDLRMDRNAPFTAEQLLNSYPEEKLKSVFAEYGEIANARQLAYVITQSRPLATIAEFKKAIASCIPRKTENKYLAMVFQALRIEVNDEMGVLKAMLKQTAEALKPGGRLVVIAYHSLEDRLVKNYIRTGNFEGVPEKDFYGNLQSPFLAITRKPLTPGAGELESNPRSRSAKLRIAERK
ncbi:MAG TPA: 16S rRNA (cytosine(1402)-N(4))-methyltransferase RsmH [Bacteroidales bacterium]|nr:16S rRNA (cytosine(1402)-N(4))-methyltransferase RsmH [Bacteroidales bacterium]HPT02746.1 16S rRNA (cytosine(1402)-N(4))-methyltransferase RsmH [Bacteroidales bacterium]